MLRGNAVSYHVSVWSLSTFPTSKHGCWYMSQFSVWTSPSGMAWWYTQHVLPMRESPEFPPRTPRCESFQRHANKHSEGATNFIVRLLGSARNGLDIPGLKTVSIRLRTRVRVYIPWEMGLCNSPTIENDIRTFVENMVLEDVLAFWWK